MEISRKGSGKGGRKGAGSRKKLVRKTQKNCEGRTGVFGGHIARYLKNGRYAKQVGDGATIYVTTVLEYMVTEVLELAENAGRENKKTKIIPRHIQLASVPKSAK